MYFAIVGALYIVLNVINVGDLGPAYRAWLMARGPYPCMIPDFPTACDGYGAAGDAWQMKSLITLVLDFLLAGCAAGRGRSVTNRSGCGTPFPMEEERVSAPASCDEASRAADRQSRGGGRSRGSTRVCRYGVAQKDLQPLQATLHHTE
jgi:hypothetical protein